MYLIHFLNISINTELAIISERGSLNLELLERKGMLKILKALAEKPEMKFTEIRRIVGSPPSTSRCLQDLVKAGLLKKEILPDRYRSVEYSLTQRGIKVAKLVKELETAITGE